MGYKVGLALSGGGAKGFAHIGVIKVLEKNNIPIDFVTGTSAGAIIGGIYASGTPINILEESILKMKQRNFIEFILDFGIPKGGFVKGKHIMKFVDNMLKEKRIENFKIPFSAVAADITNWEEKIFDRGDALLAIRSSISVPGIMKPVKIKNSILVDGGAVNPLPIDVAKKMGADIVIGVNVIGDPKKLKEDFGMKDVISETLRLTEKYLIYLRMQTLKNNIVILEPKVTNISTFSTSPENVIRAIRNGEREAKRKLPEIRRLFDNYQK